MNLKKSKELEKHDRKKVFEKLLDQAFYLLADLYTFKALFHSDCQTELLLRDAAEDFFSRLNEILHKYFILEVFRLVGPAKSTGKYNLTTQLMTELVCKEPMTETCREIKNLSKELALFGDKLKNPRNKLIAHLDLDSHISDCSLGGFDGKELDTFMRNLEDYFKMVGGIVGSEGLKGFYTLDPNTVKKPKRDVYGLLTILQKAKEAGLPPWEE